MAQEIGDRLRAARKAAHLTVKAVAKRHGVSDATVRHHENGTRAPDAVHIALYAKTYKVSTDWLILARGRGPGDEGADVIEVFDNIPPDQRQHALDVLTTFQRKAHKAAG